MAVDHPGTQGKTFQQVSKPSKVGPYEHSRLGADGIADSSDELVLLM